MQTTYLVGDHPTFTELFKNAIKQYGTLTALVYRESSWTYDDLDQKTNRLAHCLLESGTEKNEIIAVCMPQSMERVMAFLAVLKAGATYLPIDPGLPQSRIRSMIQEAGVRRVLTDGNHNMDTDAEIISLHRIMNSYAFAHAPFTMPEIPIDPDQGAYLIFTSGSTGKPKGVLVSHRSLSSFVQAQSVFLELESGMRTLQFASPSFDAAVLDLWVPLSRGATVCLYPNNKMVGNDLLSFIRDMEIELIPILPPAILASLPEDKTIGKLKTIAIGGEAGNEHTIRSWSGKVKLINSYGPTESTVAVTNHIFTGDSDPRIIGKPLPTATLYILNENNDEVSPGEAGELYIGGVQLASRYLNDDQLSGKAFVFLKRKNESGIPENIRVYRTGDRVRAREDGNLEFLGRKDEQVKIRGYRIEIGEIEHHLSGHKGVVSAAVKLHRTEENGLPCLLAFIHVSDFDASGQLISKIRKSLMEKLPEYMIPDKFIPVERMPLTHAGKVDKTKLVPPEGLFRQKQDVSGNTVREVLAAGWKYFLNIDEVRDKDHFFHLGGHSLMLASLISNLPDEWKEQVSTSDFYSYPVFGEITREIEKRIGQKQPDETERVAKIKEQLREDAILGEDFRVQGPLPDTQLLRDPGHILLTGATGFVGSHLLEELLSHTRATIYCLVRAENRTGGMSRIKGTFERFLLDWKDEYDTRIVAMPGDLTRDRLNLETGDYMALAEKTDVVYHCGSSVSYLEPYPVIRKPNIDGLKGILSFSAAQKTKFLVLMSSMGVFSWGRPFTGKTWMDEKDDIDQNLEAVCRDLGYIRTKWVMEKLAAGAKDKGLPLINLRLGFAVCNGKTGATVLNQWWGALIRSCALMKAFPLVMGLKDELTTVDYMAQAIRHIGMSPEALGKDFHLSPLPENDVSLTDFCAKINEYFGIKMEGITFEAWVARLRANPELPVYPLLGLFTEKVHAGKTLVESYEHTYYYRREHTESLLKNTGIVPPRFDRKIMEPYLKFMGVL
ncbi:amino acid adenylation domain-containing protein [Sinomicrobium pectinilyticum]|uniref:Amino acid adenylation domain-containing protein n=1 Tax=Sinomicrobium pectinilyticum TaxID=1084421 RepID=A0A3N0DR63_SINP1|nr:amino acid adenylation domain-containing protein [Sinomicrobium pectinilyticum]RNL78134.1 amino acid adenylation domain-containing protein [Sinomicrobium pectinilyticum]